jgi:NAD(P)-dependent dehydrogenase (short-subunit alcohol dehydrogenase family)
MAKNLFDISSKIIVVTGSSGILGRQYVETLLESGAKVCGLDIGSNSINEAHKKKFPNNFLFRSCNILDKKALQDCLDDIKSTLGIPNVLINNAAIDNPPTEKSESPNFENTSEKAWDDVTDVNLKGAFFCCQVFGGEMARNNEGSIVNISSIYGLLSPDQSLYQYKRDQGIEFYKPVAYSVTKAGILNLTRYLASYWAEKGVRVNSLTLAGVRGQQDKEFLQNYEKRIPIGRMAEINEYDGAILFLSSNASSYMTGSNLVIDGGWTAI